MILVLNCGSQSLKYKIFSDNLKLIKEKKITVKNQQIYQNILTQELKRIKHYSGQINKIGHRVVHGGKKFREPTSLTPGILKELQKYNKLAPLHNPFNILGIKVASKIFPKAKQIAVFDTGFYKDLPEQAFLYPLPEKIRKKYGFQRFGFHGISHQYAAEMAAKKIGRPFKKLKIISCHLGGGSSISAIKNGKAVDTSMGFTPLEGLVMMTRAGDIDPGVVVELAKIFSPQKAGEILNYQSGMKGICGLSDMKEILKKAKRGNKKANLALKVFVYRLQKYIGGYLAVLGGCDVLVFTGAIGAGSGEIRQMICSNLNILKSHMKTKILAIEANEELAIAQKLKKDAS